MKLKVRKWLHEKGYGFCESAEHGRDVFLHIDSVKNLQDIDNQVYTSDLVAGRVACRRGQLRILDAIVFPGPDRNKNRKRGKRRIVA